MRRPLTRIVCAILLIASITYLPATACKDSAKKSEAKTVAVCEVTSDGTSATLSISASEVTQDASALDAVKSTLRAGKTVGKAMVTTAVVVASSMARAARHAAAALLTTAYSLV